MGAHTKRLGNLLTILEDWQRWQAATEEQQDLAIKTVGQKLGPDFQWLGTETYRCAGLSFRIATFLHEYSAAELNLLPGGRFIMGRNDSDFDEQPAHEARVRPFLIGRMPLDQESWDLVGGEDQRAWSGQELPIVGITWHNARDWLRRAGAGLRLPSECEWEYAARAGSLTSFFWGEEMDMSYCWYGSNSWEDNRPHPAWEHEDKTNAFGLIDMLGNVFEWCEDDYLPDYREGPYDERSRSAKCCWKKNLKVVRGGAWNENYNHCSSAFRFKGHPDEVDTDFGLRIACSVPGLQ